MPGLKQNSKGFTLVEMMVTVIVLGLAVSIIAGLYYQMQRVQTSSRHLDLATRAAQTEIEVLRNNSYNSLTPGSTIDFTSSLPTDLPARSGQVEISEPVNGLRLVNVIVSYKNDNQPQQVKLSSTIGVIGIGK